MKTSTLPFAASAALKKAQEKCRELLDCLRDIQAGEALKDAMPKVRQVLAELTQRVHEFNAYSNVQVNTFKQAGRGGEITPDSIKSVIRLRGMRAKDLAEHFGISIDGINHIISSPLSGLMVADRGWVKKRE